MSEEENKEESEKDQDDMTELTELDSDAVDEGDEVDADEDVDELDESEEEEKPETGAILVVGQSDFDCSLANRGADDPGDNTLSQPQFMCRYGDMFFVTDRGNHRVLMWDQMPEEHGEPASIVLGQEDFADNLENRGINTTLDEMTSGLGDESLDGFTISQCEEDTLSAPAGIAVIENKLYVCDAGNHRAVRFESFPSEDGETPGLVLGQDNLECNEANRRGVVGSGSLFFPTGICSGDDQHVFIADKDNHRVLIWNKIPFNNGWNADVCLGQAGFDEREANRGEYDKAGPDTLSFPSGVHFDNENERIFVVDQGNHRVLIWNKLPSENGTSPDLVLGQTDFTGREVNGGGGFRRTNDSGFYFPTDVVFGRKGLFVSDSGNNRILVWKEMPTENGQAADLVIGQINFTENKFNRGGEPLATTLNDPYGLFLEEDEEDEDDLGRLYVADRGNSRIVIWEELPELPKSEEEQDALHGEIPHEEEELMGDDNEYMDDEDDDYYTPIEEKEEPVT